MLPDVVLPVRYRGSYGNSFHIVRTVGYKHRCRRPFQPLPCSLAFEDNFFACEIVFVYRLWIWSPREWQAVLFIRPVSSL